MDGSSKNLKAGLGGVGYEIVRAVLGGRDGEKSVK